MTVVKKDDKSQCIAKCEALIRSFNPVTHSIDTHLTEHLGNTSSSDAKPENVFVQQIVYGCYVEKRLLDAFIKNFYADNAACVLRADIVMYTIFAYMAIFRLQELGWHKFKEYTSTQDPSKMFNFVSYLFNKENLMSNLRDDWMKIKDLTYVETVLIKSVEKYLPEVAKFCAEMQGNAAALAAAEAAKEEAKKTGSAGLGTVVKKGLTVPVSPRLNKPRPPMLPEPDKIDGKVVAKEVPGYLNNTTIKMITDKRKEDRDIARTKVLEKYSDKYLFTFNETKSGRKIEDVRREIEEKRNAELAFDSKYVKPVPDFKNTEAKVRLNTASILREDALFRKQQAKDVQLLKNYEEELRDPTEYYIWQQDMRERDHQVKLKQVVLRREQAKQSSEEARYAIEKQQQDNKIIAHMLREQAEVIKQQKEIEVEIKTLENQMVVKKIIEVRDSRPQEEVEKVLKKRVEQAKQIKIDLEAARLAKIEEDRIEEEIKADKIRKLKAVNTVHKKHIVVFDPTKTAGLPLLSEMSYMEMKERTHAQKLKAEVVEAEKRKEILEAKQKKANDIEERAQTILAARKVKADATKEYVQKKKEAEIREKEIAEKIREEAAIKLEVELRQHREQKRREAAALIAEQERVKRQQQYLGAAAGLVEEKRNEEILMAKERAIRKSQQEVHHESLLDVLVVEKNKKNKIKIQTEERLERMKQDEIRTKIVQQEKRICVEKIKKSLLDKKATVKDIRHQHEATKQFIEEYNPYAARITQESLTKARLARTMGGTLRNSTDDNFNTEKRVTFIQ